jgi:hypothetical protein
MSTFRNPVGPQPAKVYWRRRLVVALGLLAIVLIVVLIVVRPAPSTPTSPVPSVSGSTPSATPGSTNAATAKVCDPTKVVVTASTDSNSYAAGVKPVLTFSLKSTDAVACTFSAGSDVQQFVVTSGAEVYWSSKDCQTGPVAALVVLQPFVPLAGASLTWDRTRSSTTTCSSDRPQVPAAGVSYHLVVTVNGVASSDPQFILE